MAPNAALRPFQIKALSSALRLARTMRGRVALRDLGDGLEQSVDLVLGAFDLDDEQRFHVEGVAGAGEILADLDRGLVHEFDRHRDDAGGDDAGDAGAGGFRGVKADQHRPGAFRCLEQAHGRLGDDAELAFRADDQAEDIVAGSVEVIAADIDDLAVHQHDAQAQADCWW